MLSVCMVKRKRKRGRPKSESAIRDKRVVIYLTEDDADFLTGLAEDTEFKSRSEFIAAIMERLIIGGFSPSVFMKVAFQLQRRAKATGAGKGKGLYLGIKPLPPFPDRPKPPLPDERVTGEEVESLSAALRELELEAG